MPRLRITNFPKAIYLLRRREIGVLVRSQRKHGLESEKYIQIYKNLNEKREYRSKLCLMLVSSLVEVQSYQMAKHVILFETFPSFEACIWFLLSLHVSFKF